MTHTHAHAQSLLSKKRRVSSCWSKTDSKLPLRHTGPSTMLWFRCVRQGLVRTCCIKPQTFSSEGCGTCLSSGCLQSLQLVFLGRKVPCFISTEKETA